MNFEAFRKQYGLELNNAQCEAAQAVEGPVLLLAVPGSGKTTVLISRLGYMIIGLGIPPASILTMTYTVAATKDMKERFCSFFGEEWRGAVEFRTINGVCAKIIRAYERRTGGKAFRLVSDEKESSALIASIYKEVTQEFPTESDIKNARTQITYIKNMMFSDEEICEFDKKADIPIRQIYRRYCEIMREQRAMDYDDQMVYAYRILRKHPQILNAVQNAYRYICVDEAQDTSKIQHAIISLLTGEKGNLFMVGDEDQSIYGFRAAYPEALLFFEKEHQGAKVLLMEENFRSDGNIVESADRFVQKNPHRHEKKMVAARPAKYAVSEVLLHSRKAQYEYLLKVAANCKRETAVLYRENESALPLIDLLERKGVPYRVRMPDLGFFTNHVVLDIENIIRFAYDPYDTEAFMQIYYKLSTYLRRDDARMLCSLSKSHGISVWDALEMTDLYGGTAKSCRSVQTQMYKLQNDRADAAIFRIEALMGYGDYLSRAQMKRSKLDVLSGIGQNEPSPLHLLKRLEALEKLIASGQAGIGNLEIQTKPLILSTVHSAKGLEYDTVYLIDVIDRIFPEKVIENPLTESKEYLALYEEDRRLFYVAVTRAKNHLHIVTYKGEESCFCDEFLQKKQTESLATNLKKSSASEYIDFCKRYEKGAEIIHKKFGKGTVLKQEAGFIEVRFLGGVNRKFALAVLYEKSLTE